nr:uncharacterized protein LOC107282084 [Oryza sativa Japonica Group]
MPGVTIAPDLELAFRLALLSSSPVSTSCGGVSLWNTSCYHGVEDSTGLTGTEVDLEGYAEASEGHLPQEFGRFVDPRFLEDVVEVSSVREQDDQFFPEEAQEGE